MIYTCMDYTHHIYGYVHLHAQDSFKPMQKKRKRIGIQKYA